MSIALWQEVKDLKKKVEGMKSDAALETRVALIEAALDEMKGQYRALNARVGKALKKE